MRRFRASSQGLLDADGRRVLLFEALQVLFPRGSESGLAELTGELLRPDGEEAPKEAPQREPRPEGGVRVYHLYKWQREAATHHGEKSLKLPPPSHSHFTRGQFRGQGSEIQ